jgi:hypothetical protein
MHIFIVRLATNRGLFYCQKVKKSPAILTESGGVGFLWLKPLADIDYSTLRAIINRAIMPPFLPAVDME